MACQNYNYFIKYNKEHRIGSLEKGEPIMIIITQMQQRRGTAAEWIASNPVLPRAKWASRQMPGNIKIGDEPRLPDRSPLLSPNIKLRMVCSYAYRIILYFATQFSVLGNVTSIFPVGIRVKGNCTAGTIYGTVTECTSSGDPVTTYVTVVWHSGSLDSGLSAISVGIFSPVNTPVPTQFFIPTGGYIPYCGVQPRLLDFYSVMARQFRARCTRRYLLSSVQVLGG